MTPFFILAFFLPPLITIFEFFIFLSSGKKPINGVFGFLLDFTVIIAFPSIYCIFMFEPLGNLDTPFYVLVIAVLAMAGYFTLSYFDNLLTNNIRIPIVIILGLGILLNIYMMFTQETLLIPFHVPIVLLFISRISICIDQMFTENHSDNSNLNN